MVKPLSFKGDKKSSGGSSKKRKRQDIDVDGKFEQSRAANLGVDAQLATTTTATVRAEEEQDFQPEDELSWVSAEAPSDLAGPVLIIFPTTPPSCLACDANGKIFASALENVIASDPNTAEPHDVRQVWVANRVAGTETFSLKGHHGRYLSADKFGIIGATKEAISPEESFLAIPAPDTPGAFALQTQRETFITIDYDHGDGDDISAKKIADSQVRADAEEVTFNTTFRIRMQARFKPKLKASKAEKALEKISRKELEEAVGRRLEEHEVKMLKKARRKGNYHEALLDVKVKNKHDKFA